MKDFIIKRLAKWLAPNTIKRFASYVAVLVGGWLAAVIPSDIDAGSAIQQLAEGIEGLIVVIGSLLVAGFISHEKK
jgi:predicted RecA/RadA family phage recombinase